MTDSFETKFSILADAQINEKIPSIKKYMLGFQVVASEDNNSRAIGVLAYNIGKRLVYVPVFWLNGKVKGGDIMYLKDDDRFLPLGEIWVNFISSGRDFVIGENGRSSEDQKGSSSRVSTMDLNWLYSKRAGEVGFVDPKDVIKMSAQVSCSPISLAKHLNMFSKSAAEALAKTITKSADFANAMFRHYTPQELFDIIGGRLKTASAATPSPKVSFYTDKYSKAAAELTITEKQELLDDGIVAKDLRSSNSELYSMRKANNKYTTPDESGVYSLLTGSYDLLTCTVILLPTFRNCNCYTCRASIANNPRFAMVIDTDNKEFGRADISDLMAIKKDDTTAGVEAKSVRIGSPVTLSLLRDIATDDLSIDGSNHVIFYSNSSREGIEGNIIIGPQGSLQFRAASCDSSPRNIVLTNTGGKLGLVTENSLFLPKDTKVIRLSNYKQNYNYNTLFKVGFGLTAPFTPTAVGLSSIKVASDGISYSIQSDRSSLESINYIDAFKTLVGTEGISSKQAKELLSEVKKASENTNRFYSKECVIKYAADISDTEEAYGNDHTITKEVFSTPGLTNREIQAISAASQTGVKEVLDTKILAELANSAYPLDRTADYLPTFINSLDKLGRLLFMFYWHNEAFVNRYGKQNLDQIEDSLKDNLQSLGDLVIYLKEKTITAEQAFDADQGDDLSSDLV